MKIGDIVYFQHKGYATLVLEPIEMGGSFLGIKLTEKRRDFEFGLASVAKWANTTFRSINELEDD